jgi:hypothetical protein
MEPTDKEIRKVGGCQRSPEHRNLWDGRGESGMGANGGAGSILPAGRERRESPLHPSILVSWPGCGQYIMVQCSCSAVGCAVLKIVAIWNVAGKTVGCKHRYD